MVKRASDGTHRIPFAFGDQLSAIRCGDVSQSSAEICCTAIIKSWHEKLAHEVDFDSTHETDSGKLARKADLALARDNALVPDQKEPNDDILTVWRSISGTSYRNSLTGDLMALVRRPPDADNGGAAAAFSLAQGLGSYW